MANTIALKISVDKPQPSIADITCALESTYCDRNDLSAARFQTDEKEVLAVITSIRLESEGSYDLLIGGHATISSKRRSLRIRYNPKTKVGKIEYDE